MSLRWTDEYELNNILLIQRFHRSLPVNKRWLINAADIFDVEGW